MSDIVEHVRFLRSWAADIRKSSGKSVDADRLEAIAAAIATAHAEGMEEAARIAVMLPLSELAAHSDHVNPKTAYAFGARTQASNIIAAIRRAKESKT